MKKHYEVCNIHNGTLLIYKIIKYLKLLTSQNSKY